MGETHRRAAHRQLVAPAAAPARAHGGRGLRTLLVALWVALLALTAIVAALALEGAPLHSLARGLYPDEPNPPATLTAIDLFLHNAPVALLPVALWTIRWHSSPPWRRAGDVLIAALLVRQAVVIGLGIGAWPQILSHLPHLPIEFGGLVTGGGAWIALSRADGGLRRGLNYVALTLALLTAAAVIEVVAGPR